MHCCAIQTPQLCIGLTEGACSAASAREVEVSTVPARAGSTTIVPGTIVAVTVISPVPTIAPIAPISAVPVATIVVTAIVAITAAIPEDVEGIAFTSAAWVLNADDSRAAIHRIAYQRLASTAINAFETKIRRTIRHLLVALEPTE